MPFVHIRVAGPLLSAEQTRRLQQGATTLMAEVLHKKAELTSVLVEQAPLAGWTIGARNVPAAAHLDAKITMGTNSSEDKSRFIHAAMQLLREVLGASALPEATYVVVHEIEADAWGYDGRTQLARRKA